MRDCFLVKEMSGREPPLTVEMELFKDDDLDSCLQCRPRWLVNGHVG